MKKRISMFCAALLTLCVLTPPEPGVASQLTTDPLDDIQPAWSPDGATIVFLSNRSSGFTGGFDLFGIAPDGTNERLLLQFGAPGTYQWRLYEPSWISPAGELLLLELTGGWSVLRVNLPQAALDNALPVTIEDYTSGPYSFPLMWVTGNHGVMSPVVSNDGGKLAFATQITDWWLPFDQTVSQIRLYEGPLSSNIGASDSVGRTLFQTEAGGRILSNVTDPFGSKHVAFSPDGTRLVFAACASGWSQGKRRDLYVMDLVTGALARLTTNGELGASNDSVAWSSKHLIAFSSRPTDTGAYDLFTIKPDGTELTRLTDTPSFNETDPSFNQGGNKLAYSSDMNGNYDIFVMNIKAK